MNIWLTDLSSKIMHGKITVMFFLPLNLSHTQTWPEIDLSRESGRDFCSSAHDSRFNQCPLSVNRNFELHLGLFFDFLPNLQFLSFSCPFLRPTCSSVLQPSFPWNWNVTDLPVFRLFFFLCFSIPGIFQSFLIRTRGAAWKHDIFKGFGEEDRRRCT